MKPIKRRNHVRYKASKSISVLDNISSNLHYDRDVWTPSKDQLEREITDAIEAIRSIVLNLQLSIKASDKYVLGVLDVVADDYRAQRPAGKS